MGEEIKLLEAPKKAKRYENVGRPTIMSEERVNKLETVFALGGSDEEACYYANISKQTLYNYQEKHPEFVDRKEALKNKPILQARQTIIQNLDDPNLALKYLEKKRGEEFGNKVDITSKGEKIGGNEINFTNFQ